MILMAVICYITMVTIVIVGVVHSTRKRVTPQCEPTPMGPIIGESKSVMLKPPATNSNPAQVPVSDVENLFSENKPIRAEFKSEYCHCDEEVNLSEGAESIEEADVVGGEESYHQCIDYMEMEATVSRMVRGGLTLQDQPILEQLEGTDIYNQIELVMNSHNLELVRSILNR